MLDTVVMSGDDVCCSVVFGALVGVFVFSVMWSELLMTSAISCPLWPSVYECQRHQFQMHPDITLEDTQLPLERSPKILGVIMEPSLSFHKHCNYVSDRIDKRNNIC